MSLLLSPATVLTSLAYPICLRGQVPPPRLRQHGVSTYESAFIDVRYTPVATNSPSQRMVAMGQQGKQRGLTAH
jgi:hypothetical protein